MNEFEDSPEGIEHTGCIGTDGGGYLVLSDDGLVMCESCKKKWTLVPVPQVDTEEEL